MPDTSAHVSYLAKTYSKVQGFKLRMDIGTALFNGPDDLTEYLNNLSFDIVELAEFCLAAIKEQSNGS